MICKPGIDEVGDWFVRLMTRKQVIQGKLWWEQARFRGTQIQLKMHGSMHFLGRPVAVQMGRPTSQALSIPFLWCPALRNHTLVPAANFEKGGSTFAPISC